ncbi:hypothetical protein AL535_000010 [Vibrio cholerae]|nr:hypothetical protein AL535_000010 [Vibrio cholerae]
MQLAKNKANQAQADAQGAKQNEGDRPDRQGVTGSGLSGNAIVWKALAKQTVMSKPTAKQRRWPIQ